MPQTKVTPSTVDFMSAAFVKQFQAAAKAFTRRATRSKRAAIKTLVDEGIYTAKGKLTKNYR